MYEAGAVLVSMILYGLNYNQKSVYLLTFAGAVIVAVSFISHFLVPSSYEIAWRIAFAVGLITLFSGYLIINTNVHKMTNNKMANKKKSMEKEWSYFS